MKTLGTVLIAVAVIYLLVLLVFLYRQGKFIKAALLTVVSGAAAMLIINLLSGFTGVRIPYNCWTVGTSALLGVPGMIAVLLINAFF